eukprot:TRINITY_DN3045_c0_g1_i1.p1 TRINITY_DN3045_c0_g1~~TRINITY_DN3045_c0_g1_i1.p1  ORF type:complete len:700 (+),score=151.05 TRINITY_DN3045_c0_g1_i1:131-2230(+)
MVVRNENSGNQNDSERRSSLFSGEGNMPGIPSMFLGGNHSQSHHYHHHNTHNGNHFQDNRQGGLSHGIHHLAGHYHGGQHDRHHPEQLKTIAEHNSNRRISMLNVVDNPVKARLIQAVGEKVSKIANRLISGNQSDDEEEDSDEDTPRPKLMEELSAITNLALVQRRKMELGLLGRPKAEVKDIQDIKSKIGILRKMAASPDYNEHMDTLRDTIHKLLELSEGKEKRLMMSSEQAYAALVELERIESRLPKRTVYAGRKKSKEEIGEAQTVVRKIMDRLDLIEEYQEVNLLTEREADIARLKENLRRIVEDKLDGVPIDGSLRIGKVNPPKEENSGVVKSAAIIEVDVLPPPELTRRMTGSLSPSKLSSPVVIPEYTPTPRASQKRKGVNMSQIFPDDGTGYTRPASVSVRKPQVITWAVAEPEEEADEKTFEEKEEEMKHTAYRYELERKKRMQEKPEKKEKHMNVLVVRDGYLKSSQESNKTLKKLHQLSPKAFLAVKHIVTREQRRFETAAEVRAMETRSPERRTTETRAHESRGYESRVVQGRAREAQAHEGLAQETRVTESRVQESRAPVLKHQSTETTLMTSASNGVTTIDRRKKKLNIEVSDEQDNEWLKEEVIRKFYTPPNKTLPLSASQNFGFTRAGSPPKAVVSPKASRSPEQAKVQAPVTRKRPMTTRAGGSMFNICLLYTSPSPRDS